MAAQLFYELNRDANIEHIDRGDISSSTSNYFNSLVFDRNRKTVWAKGTEYGVTRVENNLYDEDTDYLDKVLDQTTTATGVQVFRGYNNVEYSLYVTPQGKLNIFGFIPIAIDSFDSYTAQNGTKTTGGEYEVGTNIAPYLQYLNFKITGTSVDKHTTSLCTVQSNNNTYFSALMKTYNATERQGLTGDNWLATGVNTPFVANTVGEKITATLNLTDAKGNTASKEITIATMYDKCYYFFADHSIYDSATSLNYSTLSSKTGFTQWRTGTKPLHNLPSALLTDYFYVLIPARTSLNVFANGFETALMPPKTISFTNESGGTFNYKLYVTGSDKWSDQPNVELRIS